MAALDTLGFVDAVGALPEQLAEAVRVAHAADISRLPAADAVRAIVVAGMGGSGVAGDVLAAVGAPVLPVPVVVAKGYDLPAFVGPETIVIAVSYSGGTEETVAAAAAAARAGAPLLAVATGGALAEIAKVSGGTLIGCPPGLLPRAAVGALCAPVLVSLERIGLLPDATSWLAAAALQLERRRASCHPDVAAPANVARELARRIGRTMPLIYGGGGLGAVAAARWKADVNENAKAPAFWNVYPELDHNEICGWGQHGDVTRQVITLVELRHSFEHPQIARRFAITRAIIDEALAQVLTVTAEGDGPLAQLLDLIYVGDWTSVYLALDAGVDPGPIEAIFRLKDELAVSD